MKRNYLQNYQDQFAAHGFHMVNDLVDSDYLNPKVLGELLEPVLPFATCLHILKCAKEEAQCTAFPGDHYNQM